MVKEAIRKTNGKSGRCTKREANRDVLLSQRLRLSPMICTNLPMKKTTSPSQNFWPRITSIINSSMKPNFFLAAPAAKF